MNAVEVRAEVAGTVWKLMVKPGDRVEAGEPLVVIESMKMEIPHAAEQAATVLAVFVADGTAVEEGQTLLTLQCQS